MVPGNDGDPVPDYQVGKRHYFSTIVTILHLISRGYRQEHAELDLAFSGMTRDLLPERQEIAV